MNVEYFTSRTCLNSVANQNSNAVMWSLHNSECVHVYGWRSYMPYCAQSALFLTVSLPFYLIKFIIFLINLNFTFTWHQYKRLLTLRINSRDHLLQCYNVLFLFSLVKYNSSSVYGAITLIPGVLVPVESTCYWKKRSFKAICQVLTQHTMNEMLM